MTVVCLGDIDQKKFAYIYIAHSNVSVCVCVFHMLGIFNEHTTYTMENLGPS